MTRHSKLNVFAGTLTMWLPEQVAVKLNPGYDGFQVTLEREEKPVEMLFGGYRPVAETELILLGISYGFQMMDAVLMTEPEMEHLMGEFRDRIEGGTDTLDLEITLLSNLAAALMALTTVDKAKEAIAQVISQGVDQGILE